MYGQGAQAPLIEIQQFVQWAFFPPFFKSILCVKIGEMKVNRF